MPTATYEELLVETTPSRISNEAEYDALGERLAELVAKRRRSAAEERLTELLCVLVEDYDRRMSEPVEKSTPAERLQYMLECSGKTPADLLPVFRQRSHVNEALSGKRPVSPEQAKKLGAMFHVRPAYFWC